MLNSVTLIGNLTRDPQERVLQSGTRVVSFNLAVDRPGQKDSDRKDTDFIWCKCWNGVAKAVMDYVQTGDLVAVNGAINTSRKDNGDGTFTNYFEVNSRTVQFLKLKGKNGNAAPSSDEAPPAVEATTAAPSEDDIPF